MVKAAEQLPSVPVSDSEPEEVGADEQEVEGALNDVPMEEEREEKEDNKRGCTDCVPSHAASTGIVLLIPISNLFVKSLLVRSLSFLMVFLLC